jgi:predicted ATPase
MDFNRFVVIAGCSSGGKSTLLAELERRGHATVEEPGRRIVRQELARDGLALPCISAAAFARRAVQLAVADRKAAADCPAGWIFFDRGLIDAAAALDHLTGEPALDALGPAHRYHRRVFLAPPWPEIYLTDPERRHGFDDALVEYHRLLVVYPSLGYEVILLPKVSVPARVDFVVHTLARFSPGRTGWALRAQKERPFTVNAAAIR